MIDSLTLPIDNTTIKEGIARAGNLIRTLRNIGAPISQEIQSAVEFERLSYDPGDQAQAARAALMNATDPESLSKALEQHAAMLTAHGVREGVENNLRAEKYRRLNTALVAEQEQIFGYIADAFQPLADRFTEAANNLPSNLADRYASPFGFSQVQADAIRVSADVAKQMTSLWTPYKRFADLFNYLDDERVVPYAMGDIQAYGHAIEISSVIRNQKVTDAGKTLGPIFPWVILHNAGVPIRLHAAPWLIRDEAQDHLDVVGAAIGGIGTTVLGEW